MEHRPEPASLDELLAHTGWVRHLARQLLADEHHAEDVAQETLRIAVERQPHKGPGLRAWLARVARNLAFNTLRDRSRRSAREQRAQPGPDPAQPLDLVEWSERMQVIAKAVDLLEEPFRSTLTRRYFEDLSVTEIARLTKTPAATVRTRLKRGLARLRLDLKKTWGEEGLAPCLAALLPTTLKTAAGAATAATSGWKLVAFLSGGNWKLAGWIAGLLIVGISIPFLLPSSEKRHEESLAAGVNPVDLVDGSAVAESSVEDGMRSGVLPPEDGNGLPSTSGGFVVRVVDSAGKVIAGVPVLLQSGKKLRCFSRENAETDANGEASFDNLEEHLQEARHLRTVYVALGIPMRWQDITEFQRTELTDEVLARGTVTLMLPPTCRVRITVVDSQGSVHQGDSQVRLIVREADREIRLDMSVVIFLNGGVFDFPWVGLNTPLMAEFVRYDGNNSDELVFVSPTTAGGVGDLVLVKKDRTFLTGTLLGPDGIPIANQVVSILDQVTSSSGGGNSRRKVNTDSDGRFSFEFIRQTDSEGVIFRKIRLSAILPSFGLCDHYCDLPAKTSPGDYEMREMVLEPGPLILSGRVLDLGGSPIPDARIRLEYRESVDSREYWDWYPPSNSLASSEQDGSFEAFGNLPPNVDTRVTISSENFELLSTSFPLGQTDAVFRLTAVPRFHGSFLLDESIHYSSLDISFKPEQNTNYSSSRTVEDPERVNFTFLGTPGESHSLTISSGIGEVLFQQDGLVVQAGSEVWPQSIQNIDLRNRLQRIKLKVTNDLGEHLFSTAKIRKRSGSASRTFSFTGDDEGIAVFSEGPISNITIRSQGYREVTLHDIAIDQDVVLQSAWPIQVRIPPNLLGHRGARLNLDVSEPADTPRVDQAWFDENGEATVFVQEFGRHGFQVGLRMIGHKGSPSGALPRESFQVSAEGQVFDLAITHEDLDRKIDELLADQ